MLKVDDLRVNNHAAAPSSRGISFQLVRVQSLSWVAWPSADLAVDSQ